MMTPIPRNANEFIEQQLGDRARALMEEFDADVLGFSGPLLFGVDDIVRDTIENLKAQSKDHKKKLVVILRTVGGYIEVVQRIVETFRHHYEVVDFVVTNHAFSAGTVLVMSGNAIFMNYYSRLGSIDPQIETAKGRRVSAIGYLEQWKRLVEKAHNGTLTTAEAQLMIDGFDQGELYQFEQARELSVTLLKEWFGKVQVQELESDRNKENCGHTKNAGG
jgi:ClpP class serine protease